MKYIYRGQSNTIINPRDRKALIYQIIIAILLVALIVSIVTRFTGGRNFTLESFNSNVRAIVTSEMRQAINAAEDISR